MLHVNYCHKESIYILNKKSFSEVINHSFQIHLFIALKIKSEIYIKTLQNRYRLSLWNFDSGFLIFGVSNNNVNCYHINRYFCKHIKITSGIIFVTRRKIFVKNYQTIWKCMIKPETAYFFLIIKFILSSRWEFLSIIQRIL